MSESLNIEPRNQLQLEVIRLLSQEIGGDRREAARMYTDKYAQYLDMILSGRTEYTPEQILAALREKVDGTLH